MSKVEVRILFKNAQIASEALSWLQARGWQGIDFLDINKTGTELYARYVGDNNAAKELVSVERKFNKSISIKSTLFY